MNNLTDCPFTMTTSVVGMLGGREGALFARMCDLATQVVWRGYVRLVAGNGCGLFAALGSVLESCCF